ncbi:DHH family phosphoesterase [Clostridium septicum]|uniref:Bifunctional oligoribonuclease/PAP phosphatase NrnA n=1 Tax=Clostridium septicum TaxID=1504 RepID=A0A9N7JJA0_CLOSE|nr:bifunctional oligoribonuclease/PAP phosphatase NrnA [Clostridium septicum]AYE33065.1 bifunctional oligoribonuclease/PAP phosphatase NrnA [Clostridium septicum]MDU1314523.1 bifunctional oligoribonuclease/PAP phosphatase NrnA [Clostridium septicum]QAS61234.1 bifunctional oligoribonuclease/PAP phosphatase NrnA [Clostridium septicum]UEC19413.1 bifunctional oligoribonuclease/PAP phosphatase NrnA [Clostridium septicum]USR99634.1 bifunctional oligoribonuclease/PAP phosphatase NrnA [Clostridium sep
MSLNDISKSILNSNKIGITYHASPDGDAVGSALALLNALRKLKKDAYLISKDTLSDNLKFLPLSEEATGNVDTPLENTTTVVVLDCGNFERISGNLKNFKGKIINIDHHISNDYYGDENYVDDSAAATAEVVFELLEYMGINFEEESEDILKIGQCLYTSLVTDTGAFRHSNVTFKTHTIAAKLKKVGVNNTLIHQNLFDNKSFEKVRLIGKALNNMELLLDKKVALIQIPKSYAEELGVELQDTSDIISFGLQIKGVEVAVLIKEIENGSKASLRSKSDFDVRNIAESLGGGGHVKAAGITLKGICMDEAKDRILEQIEKELH